ncbi:unnamed protein product [Heterobilharzia americana]|nr:unnamed protein product [Heterobilharzia americana]
MDQRHRDMESMKNRKFALSHHKIHSQSHFHGVKENVSIRSSQITGSDRSLESHKFNYFKLRGIQLDSFKKREYERTLTSDDNTELVVNNGCNSRSESHLDRIRKVNNLSESTGLHLGHRINTHLSITLTDKSTSQCKHSVTTKSLLSEVKHFLSMKETLQPIKSIFPVVQMKNQITSTDSWTKFTKSSNAIGHIHFSLEYAWTLRTLKVVISHLTGVSNFGKSLTAFPSRIKSVFVIALRIQKYGKFPGNIEEFQEESDTFSRRYLTLPVCTSANPYFDQSFVFSITLNEIRYTELVLTVMHTISSDQYAGEYNHVQNLICPKETPNLVTSDHHHDARHQFSQRLLRLSEIPEEMKSIGVAFHKIDHEKLVHFPGELLHVWEELHTPLENHDVIYLDKATNEKKSALQKKNWRRNIENMVDSEGIYVC